MFLYNPFVAQEKEKKKERKRIVTIHLQKTCLSSTECEVDMSPSITTELP